MNVMTYDDDCGSVSIVVENLPDKVFKVCGLVETFFQFSPPQSSKHLHYYFRLLLCTIELSNQFEFKFYKVMEKRSNEWSKVWI